MVELEKKSTAKVVKRANINLPHSFMSFPHDKRLKSVGLQKPSLFQIVPLATRFDN